MSAENYPPGASWPSGMVDVNPRIYGTTAETARARNILEDSESWVLFIILALKLDSYAHRSKRNRVIAEPGRDADTGPKPDEAYRKELETHLRTFADGGDERAKELLANLMAERADLN